MTNALNSDKGLRLFRQKKYSEAIQAFQECLDFSVQSQDAVATAEMQNNLSVAYLQNHEPQKAYDVVLGTDQVFALAGDKRKQAMAIANTATALESLHRPVEALALYESSATIFEELNEKILRSDVKRRIAALQLRSGRELEAVTSMETALEDGNKAQGNFLLTFYKAVKRFFLGF
jgi:tetratricopeptide (TPR) repeat protein